MMEWRNIEKFPQKIITFYNTQPRCVPFRCMSGPEAYETNVVLVTCKSKGTFREVKTLRMLNNPKDEVLLISTLLMNIEVLAIACHVGTTGHTYTTKLMNLSNNHATARSGTRDKTHARKFSNCKE